MASTRNLIFVCCHFSSTHFQLRNRIYRFKSNKLFRAVQKEQKRIERYFLSSKELQRFTAVNIASLSIEHVFDYENIYFRFGSIGKTYISSWCRVEKTDLYTVKLSQIYWQQKRFLYQEWCFKSWKSIFLWCILVNSLAISLFYSVRNVIWSHNQQWKEP